MSNNVEDNIVSMKFDNKQFESGVATSISSTEKLKQSLQFQNAGSGLSSISDNVRGFNLNPINDAIARVNKGWAAMATIGITAVSNITNKAIDAGLRMGKALTLDPIKEGFSELRDQDQRRSDHSCQHGRSGHQPEGRHQEPGTS